MLMFYYAKIENTESELKLSHTYLVEICLDY